MGLTTVGRPTKVSSELCIDEKTCEGCGVTMRRSEMPNPIGWEYWQTRRFCNRACANRNKPIIDTLTAIGKVCSTCKTDKALSDYSPNRRGTGGKQSRCKPCQAQAQMQSRDELRASMTPEEWRAHIRRSTLRKACTTPEQFEADIAKQNGCCAICGKQETLVPDHDHARMVYRAPLCGLCNSALGFMKEDAVALRRMADYIEHHATKEG